MDTGQRRSDQDAEKPGDTDNVVRIPRDWFGPIEELVPFGPSAPDPHSDRDPDAFWGEDADTIHDVVAVREVEAPRARYRPRAVHVLVAVAAAGLGGAALIGRFEGPARVSAHRVVDRSALAKVTSVGRAVERSQSSHLQTPRRPALTRSHARPRPHHHIARTSPSAGSPPPVVEARVATPTTSTHSLASYAAPTSDAQLAYTGTGSGGGSASSNGSAATTAAGGSSSGGSSGSSGGSAGGGVSTGPEGPGAPFGPGHMG